MIRNIGDLSAEESSLFIELFESSLRIYKREHFFSWLQGCFQSLLPHEVLLCAIRLENEDELHFERQGTESSEWELSRFQKLSRSKSLFIL